MIPARENPFSSDRVLRQRYRFSENDWTEILGKLARQKGRGALVGVKGSGKTTLLEDLARRLRHLGGNVTFVRLSTECPCWPGDLGIRFFQALGPASALLIDGAEQIAWLRWLWLRWKIRRAGVVVITTHRTGRLPTIHRCQTTPALLQELVAALGVTLPASDARRLHGHHRGNIREALRELYDECAQKDAGSLSPVNVLSR